MFYALYIKPNGDNNGQLIYDLSRDKIIVTTNYQSVPVPSDLFGPTKRTESSNNKIQVDHLYIKQSIVQMDYPNNKECKSRTLNKNKDDSKDGDTDELGNSQHRDDFILDKIVYHEDQIILAKEPYKSTSVSMNESTNINNPIPNFFYSVYTNYKVYLYSIYTKPYLLFCVYVVSTKTYLLLYTYYHWYEYLYKCLHVKTFYITSTNTSLRLCSYWYLYIHFY